MGNKTIFIVMILLFASAALAAALITVPAKNTTVSTVKVSPAPLVFNYSDNDAIPSLYLSLGPTTPIANKNFSIVVTATDDKGVSAIRLLLSNGWQNFSCSNQPTCMKEFSTYEQNMGTYYYKAMVIDNAQKAAVGSIPIALTQKCLENWMKYGSTCLNTDKQYTSYYEANGCAVTTTPADNGTYVSCDYCTPSWQPLQNPCTINDSAFTSYYDIYTCFAQTGLVSDNNVPANQSTFCDYCVTDIKSTSLACTANDTQYTHFYDTKDCFGITGLVADKVPADQPMPCDYCTPALVGHNSTCAITDTYTKSYTDSNTCFSITNLSSDKVPVNETLGCDYCAPNWQPQYTSCVSGNMTKYYVDANNCFAITSLPSDNNKPANETTGCSSAGHLEPYIVLPNQSILVSGTTLVNQSRNVTVRTGVKCVGGPCSNVTAALDPQLQIVPRKLRTSVITAKPVVIDQPVITNPQVIILSANLIKNVNETPRMVIVEFKDDDFSLDDKVQGKKVKDNQDRTIKTLNSDGENFKVKYKYSLVNAMAGEINSKGLDKLLKDPSVSAIYEDFVGQGSVAQGKESLGLDHVNNFVINGKNLTGKNYSICLIDSGVNYNHESLGGGGYPNAKVIGGWNFVHNISDVYDLNGHGTKMSGILAGNGTVRGVAPDATLVEAVVLNETNWYVGSKAYAAMDWCYANRVQYNIAAVSMSFGDSIENNLTTCPSYFNAPLRNMNLAGMTLAAASGNEWFNHGIAYPSCSPYVIGVGSMDDGRYFGTGLNDTITNFTNIGFGMNFLLAPGRGIGTTDRDTGTSSCTGTSCSTPFVAAGGLLMNQYLTLKYNRTINNPKMFNLLNSTGRQIPMEDKARYNGTFTLPYFDEALMRFEVPQHKAIVSMVNTSKPFYTLQQNPASCGNMAENQVCETQWNVTATGIVGTYEFYTIYNSGSSAANTTKFNVTII